MKSLLKNDLQKRTFKGLSQDGMIFGGKNSTGSSLISLAEVLQCNAIVLNIVFPDFVKKAETKIFFQERQFSMKKRRKNRTKTV